MQIRIESPMTLGDLRDLVDQTKEWPLTSEVVARGSASKAVGPASLSVSKGPVVPTLPRTAVPRAT